MNKKGLASGVLAILIVMFIFALCSLVALKGWNMFNDTIQGTDDSVVSSGIKEKIDGLSYMFEWGDKLFITLFIVLYLSYLVSSVTIPTQQPVYLFIFLGILVITTLLAMGISNAWTFITDLTILSNEAAQLSFTNYFMMYLPFITLLMGISGAIIFYSRTDKGQVPEGF